MLGALPLLARVARTRRVTLNGELRYGSRVVCTSRLVEHYVCVQCDGQVAIVCVHVFGDSNLHLHECLTTLDLCINCACAVNLLITQLLQRAIFRRRKLGQQLHLLLERQAKRHPWMLGCASVRLGHLVGIFHELDMVLPAVRAFQASGSPNVLARQFHK